MQVVLAASVAKAAMGCGGGISPVGSSGGDPTSGTDPQLGGPTDPEDPPKPRRDAGGPDAKPDVVFVDAQGDRVIPQCVTGQVDPEPSFCCIDNDPGCVGGGGGGDGDLCALDCRAVCKKYAPGATGGDDWCNYSASATDTKVFYYCGVCGVGRVPDGTASCERGATVGERLAMQAYYEAASVIAFRRLADVLAREGAPAALVRRARRAAEEEERHARLFEGLARRRGADVRSPAVDESSGSLFALALENAREGQVRETYGALVALHQGDHAVDPELRSAFSSIAGDEIAHAELSWDLARWFDTRLSPRERALVESACVDAMSSLADACTRDFDALDAELGVPPPATGRVLFTDLFDQIAIARAA